ncbi:hypothetical protein [Nitratireductor sp. ZSWI3]|uniref:hypothetical protein n=1 Tax=Nitratireductor sp. ZSWI3 TaxID=2966359 RepID=UPI00214F973B|nr:hypothetical protein [Nitratireductor sp. ZSWI3]MCR4264813.1 hypothetical protein [Nitratireductor sp. ZSWI3]
MQHLTDYHQARHAGHLAQAASASSEAEEITARIDAGEAMSALFPEIYHRRIADALQRSRASAENAQAEARKAVTADARTSALARAYREAASAEERDLADKERLELIQRGKASGT